MAASASALHRQTSNLRQNLAHSSLEGLPLSPHTPARQTTPQSLSSYSPSTRNEEDALIFEFGTRFLRAGYANDHEPRCVLGFGPEEQRRAGDYSQWEAAYQGNWRKRRGSLPWGEAHELWRMELRNVDLGLVEDKIERAVREAYSKYLLTDSKSRRLLLALPSGLPHPLLSSLLTTLFSNLQCPSISIMSTPVLATIAAGLRSALVVDIGWSETTVTGVFEYRETNCQRSVRAMKAVVTETGRFLVRRLQGTTSVNDPAPSDSDEGKLNDAISFEEVEDVMFRTGWCQSREQATRGTGSGKSSSVPRTSSNDTLQQMKDLSVNQTSTDSANPTIEVQLDSTQPPQIVHIPFSELCEPTETALLQHDRSHDEQPDDHETPIDLLAYLALLQLPKDVRALCMARIIVIGGGSNVPGIKKRIVDEVEGLVRERGWDPVRGQAAERHREKLRALAERKDTNAHTVKQSTKGEKDIAALAAQEPDPIAEKLLSDDVKASKPRAQGTVQGCESLGAWAGASLVASLKFRGIFEVERERFLSHGLLGASREVEASAVPSSSRLSMAGPGAARAGGAGDRTSWTMGAWA